MEIVSVSTVNVNGRNMFAIEQDNSFVYLQRESPTNAAETPLGENEEVICALCSKVIEMDRDLEEAHEETS